MKKVLYLIIVMLVLTGCGSAPADQSDKLKSDLAQKLEAKKAASKEKAEPEKSEEKEPEAGVDLTTGEGILEFIAGKWTLYDRERGEDQATLEIQEDGSITLTRIKDGASASGTLSFEHFDAEEGEEPDEYNIELDDISEFATEKEGYFSEPGTVESTSGIFHIGCFEEEDYLYLQEVGNGESAVSAFVFASVPGDYENWVNNWLFYRSNGGRAETAQADEDTFYAWAWEISDDGAGVWLQEMDLHEYETYEEYSNRKFNAGYFSEKENMGVAYYDFAADIDLDGMYAIDDWNSGYPLMICEVVTGRNGEIKKISDVERAVYGIYDMGELEQDYSYKDMTFTINGVDLDMHEVVPVATAIMGCEQVGDWIIVDCHVNPHTSAYEFYNINDGLTGCFQYEIVGTNLIWQGDDLSTAVYEYYNEIFDFWGHRIGSVQEGEIYELSFADDMTIEAKCWMVDAIGRENEFTEKFEYEPCDHAVLSYYEYMLGGRRQLERLREEAPADAVALVIVNPPEKILGRMPFAQNYEEGALDKVAVVSLTGGQEQYIEPMEPGASGSSMGRRNVSRTKLGDVVVYNVTVPEGMPMDEVVVSTEESDVFWDIATLSGRIPQMSMYLLEGD